jgi:hypothetical protein
MKHSRLNKNSTKEQKDNLTVKLYENEELNRNIGEEIDGLLTNSNEELPSNLQESFISSNDISICDTKDGSKLSATNNLDTNAQSIALDLALEALKTSLLELHSFKEKEVPGLFFSLPSRFFDGLFHYFQ